MTTKETSAAEADVRSEDRQHHGKIAAIENAGLVDAALTPVYMDEALIEEAIRQLDIKLDDPDNDSGLLAINQEDGTVDQIDLSQMENIDQKSIRKAAFCAKVPARKP